MALDTPYLLMMIDCGLVMITPTNTPRPIYTTFTSPQNRRTMDSKELRLDNYVMWDRPCRVLAIDGDLLHVMHRNNEVRGVSASNVRGVELTPELLEKAGFKLSADKAYYATVLDNYCVYLYLEGDGFAHFINSVQVKYIKHLHELQNLTHTLTNQELKVSLI